MKFKAAIFDLDGTILSTLDDLADSTNAALEMNRLPRRTRDEVCSFIGNGIRLLIERAVPENTATDVINRVFEDFKAHYKLHCEDKTAPYPGILDMLDKLREHGIGIAVVSNKADFAVGALCRTYFGDRVDFAVGERDGIKRKPAPDSVIEALRVLGVDAKDAVYIGDSDVDVETAKNSGMPCISVTYGFRSREFLENHGASVFADTVSELTKLILA